MQNFIYSAKTELIFGNWQESDIIKHMKENYNPKKVLIVYGSGSVVKSGILSKFEIALNTRSIPFVLHGGVVANPLTSHGLSGIELARQENVDFILAIGGGSVIDEAKFIAIGAIKSQDALEIFKDQKKPNSALPIGAVLTIPAAGSESSNASVIREDETGIKYSIGTELIRPTFAYINPSYCMTLPKSQIGYGAADIFGHLFERYMSPAPDILSTNLLTAAMQTIIQIAPLTYNSQKEITNNTSNSVAEKKNMELWAEFCLTGTLAHNDMLAMGGREFQDWGTHHIENKLLSGIHNIAHGQGLAILFPAWLKHVSKSKPKRILQFVRDVLQIGDKRGPCPTDKSCHATCCQQKIIDQGINELENWFRSLGLATTLSELDINAETVKNDARKVFKDSITLGAYGQLTLNDILAIIDLAK
ncbi:MAG: iron-containing alcohol dehydrogenase [Firmicutes bacterium]|nr:iron-containing alcohol dehydrogenase [Bacillota bacterium]